MEPRSSRWVVVVRTFGLRCALSNFRDLDHLKGRHGFRWFRVSSVWTLLVGLDYSACDWLRDTAGPSQHQENEGESTHGRTRSVMIVIGLLGMRLNIVIPGQAVEEIAGLSTAIGSPRFSNAYFPSWSEFLLALGILGTGMILFWLGEKIFPSDHLDKPSHLPAGVIS